MGVVSSRPRSTPPTPTHNAPTIPCTLRHAKHRACRDSESTLYGKPHVTSMAHAHRAQASAQGEPSLAMGARMPGFATCSPCLAVAARSALSTAAPESPTYGRTYWQPAGPARGRGGALAEAMQSGRAHRDAPSASWRPRAPARFAGPGCPAPDAARRDVSADALALHVWGPALAVHIRLSRRHGALVGPSCAAGNAGQQEARGRREADSASPAVRPAQRPPTGRRGLRTITRTPARRLSLAIFASTGANAPSHHARAHPTHTPTPRSPRAHPAQIAPRRL
ncbi:hypothetical protein PsYK624_054850 [Phanerochaete sordida]|uniref:Uncharacterized protein n=1 Tax=Phanerochaete sordida TaxID=48140 RepID=A0A9P3G8G5_9APHY|nr:hypothetical protein PsYK624_054850 [Phanerochaete sordida]